MVITLLFLKMNVSHEEYAKKYELYLQKQRKRERLEALATPSISSSSLLQLYSFKPARKLIVHLIY